MSLYNIITCLLLQLVLLCLTPVTFLQLEVAVIALAKQSVNDHSNLLNHLLTIKEAKSVQIHRMEHTPVSLMRVRSVQILFRFLLFSVILIIDAAMRSKKVVAGRLPKP